MFQIIDSERKASILSKPTLPCLADYHAINLTSGCPFECRYCYAQGYSKNPGKGKVLFYANSYEKLRVELPRKKKKPQIIYFSTYCDPFIPIRKVLDQQFRIMELVLGHRIPILISTKGVIPDRFLALFSKFSDLVNVQVGMTTVDDDVREIIEPNAASVSHRLGNITALLSIGAQAELRMDPLIPRLTDKRKSIEPLLRTVADIGCKRAIASFLHIRQANQRAMEISLADWNFQTVRKKLYSVHEKLGSDGYRITLPSRAYRLERLKMISKIGKASGISVKPCGCKNPDITKDSCNPDPKLKPEKQLSFI